MIYSCATCSLFVLLVVVLDVSEISVTPTDVRTAAVKALCNGTLSLVAISQPVSTKINVMLAVKVEKDIGTEISARRTIAD